MTSLRRTILFWMALLLFAVGAVSAAVTYEYVKDEAQTSFDAEIKQVARFLQNERLANPGGDSAFAAPEPDNLFLIQVWNAKGDLVRTSDKTATSTAPTSTGFSIENLGQADWRSYSIATADQTIRVSLPLDERNEQASSAALQIAIPIGVVIPLSWLVLSLLIDRILAGLDKAARKVSSRKLGDSSQIPLADVPVEIIPFVHSINHHVDQVQAQAEKHKQFLSDAAHELRTPLTALAIQIGNLKSVLKTEEQHKRLAALEGGSARANNLVNRLLQLARNDAHAPATDSQCEPMAKIIQATIAAMNPQAQSRAIMLHEEPAASTKLNLPKEDFGQVLEILFDNAIRYAPEGTAITIVSDVADGRFEIAIKDQGPGIAPDKLPLVFDRFYRAAPHLVTGSGLGLSIAKAICDKHHWALALKNRDDTSGLEAIISGKVSTP